DLGQREEGPPGYVRSHESLQQVLLLREVRPHRRRSGSHHRLARPPDRGGADDEEELLKRFLKCGVACTAACLSRASAVESIEPACIILAASGSSDLEPAYTSQHLLSSLCD